MESPIKDPWLEELMNTESEEIKQKIKSIWREAKKPEWLGLSFYYRLFGYEDNKKLDDKIKLIRNLIEELKLESTLTPDFVLKYVTEWILYKNKHKEFKKNNMTVKIDSHHSISLKYNEEIYHWTLWIVDKSTHKVHDFNSGGYLTSGTEEDKKMYSDYRFIENEYTEQGNIFEGGVTTLCLFEFIMNNTSKINVSAFTSIL